MGRDEHEQGPEDEPRRSPSPAPSEQPAETEAPAASGDGPVPPPEGWQGQTGDAGWQVFVPASYAVGAFRGEPNTSAYGASKAGMNAFGQSMALVLAPHDISVGTVAPGFVDTEMAREILTGEAGDVVRAQSPFGRVARPEEVAAAVVWLASPEARFATGTIIDVNGASYLRS